MNSKQTEQLARRLAREKLSDTDLVLCRGIGVHDERGWRFAARPAGSANWEFTGKEMAVMVCVSDREVCVGKVLQRR